jgi:hypothetical protein
MKRLKWIIVTWLVLLPVLCLAADDNYGYPIQDSYAATILGTPDSLKPELPENMPLKDLVLDIIPGLEKPEIFFYDEGLRCSFVPQDHKAPLVFLIAGTGSRSNTPRMQTMMKDLFKSGYHVVVLPSPTHPNFIICASQTHIPGDLAEDSADLYRVMEIIWDKVKKDIEVSDFYIGGFSLGATQAAFVSKLDEERKIFNFRKVIMVNPAVNLYNSVLQIEGLLNAIPNGPKKIGVFFNRMLDKFTEFYREGDFIDINDNFLFAVYRAKLVSREEAGGIIGLSFRIYFAGMIFSSDVMTNGGYVVPKNRVLTNTDSLSEYFWVSTHLSFLDYFNEYFYPYFQKKRPGLTREAFINAQSLKSIEGYLKTSPKFGVITNEDDFILAPGELDYIRQLFGERAKVYPRGGHMGNSEYRENLSYMKDVIGFFK